MSAGWTVRRERDAALREEVVLARRAGCPPVLAVRRAGSLQKVGLVAVRYGAADLAWRVGRERTVRSPAGVAHFLEHQLFEGEEIGAFDAFSRLGASSNAFTDLTETAYHFQCVDRFGEAFRHLLSFVGTPHFTRESVRKEKGVIAQEIRMYDDDADSVCHQSLLRALFARHPVRIDIAGTVGSIGRISPATLRACYDAFYHPARMAVVAVADVPLPAALAAVKEAFRDRRFAAAGRALRAPESGPVARRSVSRRMEVSRPKALVGFKETILDGSPLSRLRRRVETSLAGDLLFGPASRFYQEAYAAGLVDEDFGFGLRIEEDFGYSVVGGRTRDPARLRDAILAEVRRWRREGVPRDGHERARTKAVGGFLRAFHSPGGLAPILASCHFEGVSLFDHRRALDAVRPERLERRIAEHFREDRCAMSTILPV